jgi:DNA-binding SARP family transcriptional activator
MRLVVNSSLRTGHDSIGCAQGSFEAPVGVPIIRLLGNFELALEGASVDLSNSARRLVAFLALADGLVSREHVAYSLWPDAYELRAQANLRSALWRVRQADTALIESVGGRIRLSQYAYVDARAAMAAAQEILAAHDIGPADGVHRILTAGDLLTDWYDSWVIEHRERLRQLRLHALELMSVRQLETGEVTAAIESALAAVAAEPLRESANRVLIRAHLKEANNAEALRQYERFRLLLFQELGIWPSAQLEELMAPVRASAARTAAHI